MKKNDFKQLISLSIKELEKKVDDLEQEIADAVLDKNMKKLKDVKLISKKRKDLAQVNTVKRQKELLDQLESKMKNEEPKKEEKEDNKEKTVAKKSKEATGVKKEGRTKVSKK